MEATLSIRIPSINDDGSFVELFLDELPDDYNDISDVLRSELAPLRVWRSCAVEYHRQGFNFEFETVLNEIVESMGVPEVEQTYRQRQDFAEGMTDIYNALAAKALSDLIRSKENSQQREDYALKVVENLRRADDHIRVNEYTWLIKGFYEITQGEYPRAEANFHAVHDRAKSQQAKVKFLFGALVGLAIVSYSQHKYQAAIDYFAKCIQGFSSCSASIRFAVAVCCYKIGQYDRSRMAALRALSLDPTNSDALVLLALLDHVTAQRDRPGGFSREHRKDFRLHAYEYCTLAAAMNPSCSLALNQMANHTFHTWKTLVGASDEKVGAILYSDTELELSRADAKDICVGDQLRLNRTRVVYRVVGVKNQPDSVPATSLDKIYISISPPADPESELVIGSIVTVDAREFGRALRLANDAINSTTVKEIKSEGYYIMGKVYHAQNNIDTALAFYRKALELSDMMLAAFGVAQIQLSRNELATSLEIFERVLSVYPNDKDTQAFVMLVKALHKKESSSLELVKDVAPGFQFEIDLWLAQGQLRLKNSSDYPDALRCLLNAFDCIQQQQQHLRHHTATLLPSLLSNIAVLHHSVGLTSLALDFMKKALVSAEELNKYESEYDELLPDALSSNPPFRSSELEGVFFSWSQPVANVRVAEISKGSVAFSVDDESGEFLLTSHISPGDDILIDDILHRVISVKTSSFVGKSAIPLNLLGGNGVRSDVRSYTLKKRVYWSNFSEMWVTLCYNFARVLEDVGQTSASTEVYVELLKKHPSFIECYLRLSRMSRDMGKFDEASSWLSRALAVDDTEPDVNISLGDLYARSGHWEDSKKCYEKVCIKNHHDARAMISLGNLYFSTLSTKDNKYDGQVKNSYKFFYHALQEDRMNVFAANGLGMICVEKQALESARQIFARARESNMSCAEDISLNLAHLHLMQERFVEAEHLYQATIKALPSLSHAQATSFAQVSEYTSFSQFKNKRHEESLRSLLRATHLEPTYLRLWYNLAVVRGDLALLSMKKEQKTVADIESASAELTIAHSIFSFTAKSSINQQNQTSGGRLSQYDRETAERHARVCEANKAVFNEHLQDAVELEEMRSIERKRQEQDHLAWKLKKEEERAKSLEEAEKIKESKQIIAEKQAEKLKEMKEKWVAPSGNTGLKKRKLMKGKDNDVASGVEYGDNVGEPEQPTTFGDIFGSDDDDDPATPDIPSGRLKRKISDAAEDPDDDIFDEPSASMEQMPTEVLH